MKKTRIQGVIAQYKEAGEARREKTKEAIQALKEETITPEEKEKRIQKALIEENDKKEIIFVQAMQALIQGIL